MERHIDFETSAASVFAANTIIRSAVGAAFEALQEDNIDAESSHDSAGGWGHPMD
jgi:hypothetical protein